MSKKSSTHHRTLQSKIMHLYYVKWYFALIDWLKLLMTDDVDAKILREKDPKKLIPPLHGALLKNEQDVHLFERLAFISRRENENAD